MTEWQRPPHPSRDPHARLPYTRWLLSLLCLTLAWDASGLDLTVMSWLGDPTGFALRNHPLLANVLHDGARRLGWVLWAGVALSAWYPWGPFRRLSKAQRLEAASGILLSLIAINLIKYNSLTSCPWDLNQFGGEARFVSHWDWLTRDGGPGRCFPGGHASAGFAFLALAWPWAYSTQPTDQQLGQRVLLAALTAGLVLGAVQTLRGAHYPSHTLWTALMCWGVSWAWHWLIRRLVHQRAPSV